MGFIISVIKAVPITLVLLLFLVLLHRLMRKSTRSYEERQKAFWDREQEANFTRKKDISGLPYIKVPLDRFPFGRLQTPEISELEQQITELADKPILNLNGKTNTDLKLEYGAANLPVLSDADVCYTDLIAALTKLAVCYHDAGDDDAAAAVLEYSIEIGSDTAISYTLLRDIYRETLPAEDAALKIKALSSKASELNSIRRDAILQKLEGTNPGASVSSY